jgi:hypothetical protein
MRLKRNMPNFIEIAINIPSGKIAFDDDLRYIFGDDQPNFELNEILGLKLATEHYGRLGIFHGFVGNSSPSVYQNKNKIAIGCSGPKRESVGLVGKKVGTIITGLWWYSLMDYDLYVSKGGDPKVRVINVTPGRYVLKHRLSSTGWAKPPTLFASLEKSNRKVKAWKLPEEGVADALLKVLPKNMRKSKNWIQVKPSNDEETKGLYKVSGRVGPKVKSFDNKGKLSKSQSSFAILVKETDLKHTKTLMKKVIKNVQENHLADSYRAKKDRTKEEWDFIFSLLVAKMV